jgi:hypothetical protein
MFRLSAATSGELDLTSKAGPPLPDKAQSAQGWRDFKETSDKDKTKDKETSDKLQRLRRRAG